MQQPLAPGIDDAANITPPYGDIERAHHAKFTLVHVHEIRNSYELMRPEIPAAPHGPSNWPRRSCSSLMSWLRGH